MRVALVRAGGIHPAKIDTVDVTRLANLAVDRIVSIPSFVIKEMVEIMTRFIA